MPVTISLDELALLTSKILNALKEEGYSHVAIDADYYWIIEQKELYDPYKEPAELTLGQLTWDLEALRKIANGENEVIPQHLVWLGELLKSAGYSDIAR